MNWFVGMLTCYQQMQVPRVMLIVLSFSIYLTSYCTSV